MKLRHLELVAAIVLLGMICLAQEPAKPPDNAAAEKAAAAQTAEKSVTPAPADASAATKAPTSGTAEKPAEKPVETVSAAKPTVKETVVEKPTVENAVAKATAAKATVHFYRYREHYGAMLKPSVFCDGKQVARLVNGRHTTLELEPGKHVFTSNFPENGIVLDLKPGEHYYLRMGLSQPGFFHNARGQIFMTSKEQAEYEVQKLKPLDENDFKWGKPDAETQKLPEKS